MRSRLSRVLDGETTAEALATKVLGVTFVLALVVVVVLAITSPGASESYTEFYVLGPDGTASDYPENVSVGETATVQVGVRNFENQRQTYTVVVRTNETTHVTRTVTVDPEERWEEPVSLTFDSPGRKRLRLELYVGESTDAEPYRTLRLFVRVDST